MKILLYSLLHKHYNLLPNLEPIIPYCDEVLVVDNTPAEQRQETKFNTFIPPNTNSSYGKAIYESSKFIPESIDYVLWCSQDVIFSEDSHKYLSNMLDILNNEEPGALACSLTGSVMEKYGLEANHLPAVSPLIPTYSLINGFGHIDYTTLETVFLFIKSDIFKRWASVIRTFHIGYLSEPPLIAEVYKHQKNNEFLVYCKHVANHDRSLTVADKEHWVSNKNRYKGEMYNLISFLEQEGVDIGPIMREGNKIGNNYTAVHNAMVNHLLYLKGSI